MPIATTEIDDFIARWAGSGANERANYQLFLSELCDVIGVARPEPASASDAVNDYIFERSVDMRWPDGTTSKGRIDLYRKGCFVLEAKQGVEAKGKPSDPAEQAVLNDAPTQKRTGHGVRGSAGHAASMLSARGQAERYAKALPEWPPFIVVVDVGHVIELWADFSRSGKNYAHFPDAKRFRIRMEDLRDEDTRTLLRDVWTDPMALTSTISSMATPCWPMMTAPRALMRTASQSRSGTGQHSRLIPLRKSWCRMGRRVLPYTTTTSPARRSGRRQISS